MWQSSHQAVVQYSEAERRLYEQVFRESVPPGETRLSGEQAAAILARSGLDRKVLKQIWDFADSDRHGTLGLDGFSKALRLIAHAQSGCVVSEDLARLEPAQAPRFDGGGVLRAVAAPPGASTGARGRSPPRTSSDNAVPSLRDLRKYGRFFCQAVGRGDRDARMSSEIARDVLGRSGLSSDVLARVWDLADVHRDGIFPFPFFVVAMHLIKGVRGGQAVPPALPPQLVACRGALDSAEAYASQPSRSPRSTSAPSSPSPSTSHSRRGPPSRSRSPSRGENRLVPTPRDLRKYGRLFCRSAGSGDRVPLEEARGVFNMSGLPESALREIWNLADIDRDGHLIWPEFVVAMHLIRRTRAEQPLPPHDAPGDLLSYAGTLDSAEAYASQTSRSPRAGRSGASTPFGSTSRPVSPKGGICDDGFNGGFSGGVPTRDGFASSNGFTGEDGLNSNFTKGSGAESFGVVRSPKAERGSERRGELSLAKEEKRSGHRVRQEENEKSLGDLGGRSSRSALTLPTEASEPRWTSALAGFGDGLDSPSSKRSRDVQPVEHIEVLIEADKRLATNLRLDIDMLHEELERLEDQCRWEETEMTREKDESERIGEERRHLLAQLEASRRQLGSLKSDRQDLHGESIMWHRNHGHYHREATFLKRLFDEGLRDTEALQQSIEYLEQSNQGLLAHTRSLEDARREVLEQVRTETELLEKERWEAVRSRAALDALRGAADSAEPSGAPLGFADSGLTLGGQSLGGGLAAQQRPQGLSSFGAEAVQAPGASTPWYSGLSLMSGPGDLGGALGGAANGSRGPESGASGGWRSPDGIAASGYGACGGAASARPQTLAGSRREGV